VIFLAIVAMNLTLLWTPNFVVLLAVAVALGARIIYLRNLGHCPPDLRLRRKGLDSLLAGKPAKAEEYFRKSMTTLDESERVRALVCLSDALLDQGKYEESKETLIAALKLGDPTGSGQGTMADLLLLTGADPEKALEMTEQSFALTTGRSGPVTYFGGKVSDDLRSAKCWARKSMALSQLGRNNEARQAVQRASRLADGAREVALRTEPHNTILVKLVIGERRLAHHRDLAISATHWRIGLAFLAMGDSSEAARNFSIVRNTDRRGKYRNLAQRQLDQLKLLH
jgi:tetratricopeptide (TPR) repeat protein